MSDALALPLLFQRHALLKRNRNAGATLTRTGYPATTMVIGVNSRVATVSLRDVRSRNSLCELQSGSTV